MHADPPRTPPGPSSAPSHDPVAPEDVSGAHLLETLGYQQDLKRALSVFGTIALTVSDITPTASLLIVGPVAIATAGTGAFWAYVLAGLLALCVALCMGELGSMFPVAGGLYSIVTRVLGRPIGFLALLDYIGQAIFLPASIALGIGTYLTVLFPAVNTNLAALIVMVAVTIIAVFTVSASARLTTVFLALELLVVATLAVAGFLHVHQPVDVLIRPVTVSASGVTNAIGVGLVFTAVATALFSYNGYDSAINFSEETEGTAAHVGQAVVRAALIGVVFEVIPLTGVLLAAPHLGPFITSSSPFTYVMKTSLGGTINTIVTVGAIVAIFNACLAITLQFARILYSSGRDRAWPGPINTALARVHPRFGSPWVATLVVGGMASVLTFFSSLVAVVTFTSVLIIILYALIAVSALVSRMRQPRATRPYRMPLWPLPPIIALVGVVVAITQQKGSDLLICAAIVVIGAMYYALYLRSRAATHWAAGPITAATPPAPSRPSR